MNIMNFQMPEQIVMHKADDFQGVFEFKPLEPGFGQTVGNTLRRVLLSSLEGYAISAVRIGGVDHEFSTITGVTQDVIDIILNLKQVRIRPTDPESDVAQEQIYLTISGKEEFVAGDITANSSQFEIMNPELLICRMEPSVNLEIELTVKRGRGYEPAGETLPKDSVVGVIPMDAIYTPIKKVSYRVENTRVEQRTDFEQLTIEVATDGTIHPEEAVKEAARIMIRHMTLITNEDITFSEGGTQAQNNIVDEEVLAMRKLLKTSLEDLDLSVRAYNCLKAAKINSLANLVSYDTHELLKFRNFGKKSLVEIDELLAEKGLSFGMDISKYDLDDE